MSCTIRPYRRFPVCCPVTYQVGDFEGHGTLWNLSLTGWRFSGDLPLRESEFCSLTVALPNEERVYALTVQVCWVRGEEFGVFTISMDDDSREALEHYLDQRIHDWMESHW